MRNLLFLCLGSNYDPVLEEKFGFIQNYLELGNNVKVLSIDIQPLPETITDSNKQLTVERIQQRLDSDLAATFVAEHVPKKGQFDEVIICDGIHFLHSEVGKALQDEITKVYGNKVTVSLFQYISPKYKDAHFNGLPLQDNNNFDFSSFITSKRNMLLPLFKDPIKGEQVLNQLTKSLMISKQASYDVIQKFTLNVGTKLFKPDGLELFASYLNNYLVENISLDFVKNEKSSRSKHRR